MRSCSAHIACEDLNLVCQRLRADFLCGIPRQCPWPARACVLQQQGHVSNLKHTMGAVALEPLVDMLQQPYASSSGALHWTDKALLNNSHYHLDLLVENRGSYRAAAWPYWCCCTARKAIDC